MHRLRTTLEENGTILISRVGQLDLNTFEPVDKTVNEIFNSNLKQFSNVFHSAESPWVYPWQDDFLIQDERINIETFDHLNDQITFIAGDWGSESSLNSDVIPVLVMQPMAQAYNLSVGDRLPLSLNKNETEPSFWMEVEGIVEPADAQDPFWYIDRTHSHAKSDFRFVSQFSALVPEKEFFELVPEFFSTSNLHFNWLAVVDFQLVHVDELNDLIMSINHARGEFSDLEDRFMLETNFDRFLEQFDNQATSVKPPLYLLVGETLFLSLYYVTMVAALFARQAESEYATISSRGASMNQLLQIQTFDSLLVCSIALICGPLLAYGLVWALTSFGPIADVSASIWIAALPRASWVAAGVSILACFTSLLIPVIPHLRFSIVEHKRTMARRIKKPWWQKYYVDIFLLVVAVIAIWRLSLYGSISAGSGSSIDWVLLLAPLALLIGSAAILLRIFPPVFSLLAKLASYSRGLIAPFAFWQSSRDPAHVTRLVFLFTLAMALGILSTGISSTLNQSEKERARFAAGGEIRLESDAFIPQSELDSTTSITGSSAVWRGSGITSVRSFRSVPGFELLAVEPISFATVSQYRTDFTDQYIGYVLGRLIVEPDQLPVATISLPGIPRRFGLWIVDPNPDRTAADLVENLNIRAKFQTSQGRILVRELILTPVSDNYKFKAARRTDISGSSASVNPIWRFFDADLPLLPDEEYPLSLHSLWVKFKPLNSGPAGNLFPQGPLVIDDLSITSLLGEFEIVEGFEQLSTIWQTGDTQTIASFTKREITHTGQASMRLFFGASGSSGWLVLSPATPVRKEPVPVLASPVFLEQTELDIGDKFIANIEGSSFLFGITEKVNYFPTMYETVDRGYLVVARDPLLAELNKISRNAVNPTETWLNIQSIQEIPSLIDQFNQASRSWDVETERIKFKSDPLTLGLRTVIFLGYSMTLLLSLVGFTTYFYMSARSRTSIYGILRSLGISTSQLYASLVIEQLILIISGLAIGVLLGTVLNDIVLPGLPISFGGLPPIPPFIPYEDWNSVISIIVFLSVCFLIMLAVGTVLLWRTKLHRVLRVGEE